MLRRRKSSFPEDTQELCLETRLELSQTVAQYFLFFSSQILNPVCKKDTIKLEIQQRVIGAVPGLEHMPGRRG